MITIGNIKKTYKQREESFKRKRKEIKNEMKCSWREAGEIAAEYFDATYGTYDSYFKLDINNIDDLINKISNTHRSYSEICYEFLDREYQILYDFPIFFVDIIDKNKKTQLSFQENSDSLVNNIENLKNIIKNKKIKEVYYGCEHRYGSWCYPEWMGYEVFI